MSKKISINDPFQPKITRNDRFAQMSHQEKVIEQKKKEIQAKLDAKLKTESDSSSTKSNVTTPSKQPKNPPKKLDIKKLDNFNLFSNDGSFLDTFKQLKDKRLDSKLKSFKSKDRNCSGEQRNHKINRWSQRKRSPSPKHRNIKLGLSRFSDKPCNVEPRITINTSFNQISHPNFDGQLSVTPQNVTGQPLLKNVLPSTIAFPTVAQSTPSVIAAPPLLLNVPPPQILQSQMSTTLVLPTSPGNVIVATPTVNVATLPTTEVLTTITLPPPTITSHTITVSAPNSLTVSTCVPTVELSSIPPPNPIQVQNIPQPEPINALNIPHPAPIQVQNIPTPSSIQLNEIPNPKPLDLLTIPTPNDEKSMTNPDFIKNIPPPNKSIPPPSLPEANIVRPQNPAVQSACLSHPNISVSQSISSNLSVQSITSCQNILVHTIPPPQPIPPQIQTLQSLQHTTMAPVPPPNLQNQNTFASVSSISMVLPVGVVSNPVNTPSSIPSLMAQPILPPPGIDVATVNVNCPPPLPINIQSAALQAPPPSYMNQPPPITNQMPPMNVPPPQTAISMINAGGMATAYRDINEGTPDYEAMASLGRMVAQCGPGIEDVVRQRKMQDPSLWFLFHRESAAYQQYRQLVAQFTKEMCEIKKESDYKPEDIYEPEMATDDDQDLNVKIEIKGEMQTQEQKESDMETVNKKKRKSRWGDKDPSIPPPSVIFNNSSVISLPQQIPFHQAPAGGNVMLSKITKSDPALVQYAINTFGSANLTDEEWRKAEDHYKINLLYQDMMKKRNELEKMQQSGRNKYDYDSDEDTEGGTWEHKLRDKEMMATQLWAQELNRQAEGKHHIGDFLPPEELKRFMEKSNASKEGRIPNFSDYKEFKIKEDNIGFKMLQKLGWSEGQGLGFNGAGIVEPVNKAACREQNQGLGLSESSSEKEDEYEAYRKRMMLAYRFRPNPLNNPRRPYY